MNLQWGMSPEFDWSSLFWLIFWLAISILLVKVISKRIVWLLPAFVLYIGVGWEMPPLFMWVFRILFWGSVIAVIFTAIRAVRRGGGRTRVSRLPLALMILLIIFLIGLGLIGGSGSAATNALTDGPTARPAGPEDQCLSINGNKDYETIQTVLPKGWSRVNGSPRDCEYPEASETLAPTSSPSSTVTKEPEAVEPSITCPEQFVQDLDPNFRQRSVTEGFTGLPGVKRTQMLEDVARDYRYLDAVGDYVFERDFDASTLYATHDDVFCLSEAGQNLYRRVWGALMASPVASGLAPENGYNSGFKDRTFIIRERQGVRGDRRATIYTLSDGRELVILDRCGNIVFPESHRD